MLVFEPYLMQHTYALGSAASLLDPTNQTFANKLKYAAGNGQFNFNSGYNPLIATDVGGGGPQISATANTDPSKGLDVTDPINNLDFTVTPNIKLLAGEQQSNRIVYPLLDGTGWMVYSMEASQVTEDILLNHANSDSTTLPYKLSLGDSYVARMEKDGAVDIYGSSLPLDGQVSTGSTKDAQLLQKARQNAAKNKLLFQLPPPVVTQTGGKPSKVQARYVLHGSSLETVVTNLQKGVYPLAIDPTVTVTSTSDLFRDTNPESDIDFNNTTGTISRGAVTGGVIPQWTGNSNNLGTARFLAGATINDSYAYVAGGAAANSTSDLTSIEVAQLSKSASCGTSCIGAWSTTTSLPVGLSRFKLLAYDGYLYAIGGSTTDTSCTGDSNNIYYNRIQVNGQLSASWSTNTNTLPSAVCGLGAVAYNGMMYVVGGRTGAANTTGVTTVAYASINPDGSLGTWTTSSVALPSALYDADLQVYDGNLYVIGGSLSGGTLSNSVHYTSLNSNGTIYGSGSGNWLSTSSFTTARSNMGGTFTTVNDGFMYLTGGCSAFNSSQQCTTIQNDIQIAQINADGSLGTWSTDAQATHSVVGNSIKAWEGTIFSFAGCTAMTTTGTNISCQTGAPTLATQSYSAISGAGQVGPLNTGTAMTTGLYDFGAVVNNGYIYVVGGCLTANGSTSCQTGTADTSDHTYYAPLNADGTVGSWTTDTHTIDSTTGLASEGIAIYNNYIYVTGGYTYAGPVSTTYYALTLTGGGLSSSGWQTTTAIPRVEYSMPAVAYRGYLFMFGGCIAATHSFGCSTYYNNVYSNPINAAGTISGTWTSVATLNATNQPEALMGIAAYNGYVYLTAGASGAAGQSDEVYYATISNSGGVGSFSATTGILTTDGTTALTLRRTDAYAMNGYLYVLGGHDGSTNTTYGTIQIGAINMSTGNVPSNFTPSVTVLTPRWDAQTVFANGYIYTLGGCSSGNPPATCNTGGASTLDQYVEEYNAGNKNTSAWTTATNTYTTNVATPGSVAYNGYIYLAGGCGTAFTVTNFSGDCASGNEVNTVYYAAINPDGSIGTWANNSTYNLPAARAAGCMVEAGGYLYYIGGEDNTSTASATVYYSQIGGSGTPGAWSTATDGLPAARMSLGCDVFDGYVYAAGGLDGSSTVQATVYNSPSLASGGNITSTWTTDTSFTTARENLTAVTAGSYLYIMGGDNKTTAQIDVQYIQLSPTTGATTGSWGYGIDLPQPISGASAFAANGYIYVIGGRTAATTCMNTTTVAAVNSTGTTSNWSTSINNLAAARFGMGVAFYDGYYFSLGGDNCTSIISSAVIQGGGERSQAMYSLWSKYADLNDNGTPYSFVGYLTNAQISNVDIEKWNMSYLSSFYTSGSTPSWGVSTTITGLTSQALNTVHAYNGSSTNIVVSRWFFLSLNINELKTFTFPDANQPNVSQYQLYYSPPPNYRLMHGKDFRDQTQQDLDAFPYSH